MGIWSSEYGEDWEAAGKPKDPSAPRREDYTKSGARLFVEHVGVDVAKGVASGAKFGAPGMLLGGAIGLATGLFGAEAAAQEQDATFQQAYGAWKTEKDRKKMADQAAKAQMKAQKSQAGKKGRKKDLAQIPEYDADLMGLAAETPRTPEGTQFQSWHSGLYTV